MADKRFYESVFVSIPTLDFPKVEEKLDGFLSLLRQGGAVVLQKEELKLSPLAYRIGPHQQGIYAAWTFEAPPSLIQSLEIAYQRDDQVIRFLTIALSEEAMTYKHNKQLKQVNKGVASVEKAEHPITDDDLELN